MANQDSKEMTNFKKEFLKKLNAPKRPNQTHLEIALEYLFNYIQRPMNDAKLYLLNNVVNKYQIITTPYEAIQKCYDQWAYTKYDDTNKYDIQMHDLIMDNIKTICENNKKYPTAYYYSDYHSSYNFKDKDNNDDSNSIKHYLIADTQLQKKIIHEINKYINDHNLINQYQMLDDLKKINDCNDFQWTTDFDNPNVDTQVKIITDIKIKNIEDVKNFIMNELKHREAINQTNNMLQTVSLIQFISDLYLSGQKNSFDFTMNGMEIDQNIVIN